MNNLKKPLYIFQKYTKGTIGSWPGTHSNFVVVTKKTVYKTCIIFKYWTEETIFLQITSFKHTSLSNNSFPSTEKFTNSNVFLQ